MVYDLGLSAWRKPESVAGSAAPAIMIGCFVAFGGILFGYDTGYVSSFATCLATSSIASQERGGLTKVTLQHDKRHNSHALVAKTIQHRTHDSRSDNREKHCSRHITS